MQRCNFVASISEKSRDRAVNEQSFCVLLKLSWYKFKLVCYNVRMLNVIPMVTKNIVIENTQKEIRRELKRFTRKNQLNIKETVMQEMRDKKS